MGARPQISLRFNSLSGLIWGQRRGGPHPRPATARPPQGLRPPRSGKLRPPRPSPPGPPESNQRISVLRDTRPRSRTARKPSRYGLDPRRRAPPSLIPIGKRREEPGPPLRPAERDSDIRTKDGGMAERASGIEPWPPPLPLRRRGAGAELQVRRSGSSAADKQLDRLVLTGARMPALAVTNRERITAVQDSNSAESRD